MIDLNKRSDARNNELRDALELMYFSYRSFTAGPDRILEKRGLNRTHHRILYFIGRDAGQPVGQLLQTLSISKQALNKPLRQLIAMGLVSDYKAAHDGRVKELRLSATGKQLEAQLSATQQKQLAEVFDIAGPKAELEWKKITQALVEISS